MYTKKSPRVTFKSNRRSNFRRNNNYSNGKIRNKGNVSQQYNKYLKLAKEASSSGDRIQSEYYYQFTDHYYRLMVEMGINIEDGDLNLDSKSQDTNLESKKEELDKNELVKNDSNSDLNEENESIESIESIPFIAEPAKKKRVRTTK
tara:strand:+ start:385 stop:825 length:441 start_codon:yes stop_codon:yes gene_type:complete